MTFCHTFFDRPHDLPSFPFQHVTLCRSEPTPSSIGLARDFQSAATVGLGDDRLRRIAARQWPHVTPMVSLGLFENHSGFFVDVAYRNWVFHGLGRRQAKEVNDPPPQRAMLDQPRHTDPAFRLLALEGRFRLATSLTRIRASVGLRQIVSQRVCQRCRSQLPVRVPPLL